MIKLIQLLIMQHKYRKAMNILSKQEWSIDFLVYLLRKAKTRGLAIRIREPNGRVLEIVDTSEVKNDYYEEEVNKMQNDIDIALGLREFDV